MTLMQHSPCSLGEIHATDFETLKYPDSYYTPHRSGLFCITPDVFYPVPTGTMTTVSQSPNTSTSQPINKASQH